MPKLLSSIFRRAAPVALLAIAPLCATAARAGSLPAAVGATSCATNGGYVADPSSCNVGTDSASVSLSPYAAVQASGAFPGGLARVNAGAFATLDYSFEVVGGQVGDLVPVDIEAALSAVPYGGGYVFSEILATTNESSVGVTICSDSCGAGDGVTSYNGVFGVQSRSGEVGSVHLEVEGIGNFSMAANGGTASVDPLIYIDPGFAGASDYSIELSPGVANAVPGVPEPAAWTMMLTGFGLLGLAARRRRAALA